MNHLKVYLTKNLRKTILQGDPWIYQNAIERILAEGDLKDRPCLAKVYDQKNIFVAWAMWNPSSPLRLRILSLDEQPPSSTEYRLRLNRAVQLRDCLKATSNSYRLVNGEGDLLPGFVCDRYADVAVLQFDGEDPYFFWDREVFAQVLIEQHGFAAVYFKPRFESKLDAQHWGQASDLTEQLIIENGVQFKVDILKGQKTGFFFDQRENRQHIRETAAGKSVLNLFSYSGGFSIYAGLGGAAQVTSMDISDSAIQLANENWLLNKLNPVQHQGVKADIFDYLKEPNSARERFDMVICDPPSLMKAEKSRDIAVQKYVELFQAAARKVKDGGNLVLSSCSSHLSFEDFLQIVDAALSKARKRGQILRISGQGLDHPYPHACPHLRYLKFIHLVLI